MNNKTMKTVVVGMSGGVDSSVSALLLKNQGYRVIGLHMKNADEKQESEDALMVKEICDKLQIECHVVSYDDQMQKVKDYFLSEYLAGRTPNPCVVCNREVKFRPFVDYANEIGADYFATGHYADIEHTDNKHYLKKSKDEQKDQSYFLNQLSQEQLAKALFPLNGLKKDEVRKIAEENGLVSAHKKDSYDVCFVGNSKFRDYMQKINPEKPGNIIDESTGKVVGKHNGISKYTIGQRKGLGIGGGHGESGEGWFVTKKDIKTNTIFVTQGNGDILFAGALKSYKFNWIPEIPNKNKFTCFAKTRYRQADQEAEVLICDDGVVFVSFKEKQRAITLGQFVVLYTHKENGESYCLGGGTIDEVIK